MAHGQGEDVDEVFALVADHVGADDAVGVLVHDDLGPGDGFGRTLAGKLT